MLYEVTVRATAKGHVLFLSRFVTLFRFDINDPKNLPVHDRVNTHAVAARVALQKQGAVKHTCSTVAPIQLAARSS